MRKISNIKSGFRLLMLTLIVLFGLNQTVQAQSGQIKGAVTDENSQPLPGATIIIKGTSQGTTSDFDGNYAINNPGNGSVLIISYVGYLAQEVEINGRSTVSVSLKPDAQALDEVLIVGYGEEKKSLITGAIASVDTGELNKSSGASFNSALQGKVAGVSVVNNNATPGGGVSVRIRGIGGVNNSEPLYVIDGMPISVDENENSSPMSSINPQDIKSITILKDAASSAIYGTRAANGVVLITTKRGKGDEKGTVSISTRFGSQSITKAYDMMDAQTYVAYMNLLNTNAGLPIAPGFENPSSFGVGTDWVDAVTRVASVSDLQASFSGGTENSNIFLSLGHFKQDGIVKGSTFERVSMRANADLRISKKFKVGSSLSLVRSEQNAFSGARNTNVNAVTEATLFYPTIPVYDENGGYAPTPTTGQYKPKVNPLFTVEGPKYPPILHTVRANVFAEYKILPNLKFKTSVFYTYSNTVDENIGRIYDLGAAVSTEQIVSKLQVAGHTALIENTLNYGLNLDDHSINLLVGQSAQESKRELLSASGEYPLEGNYVVTTQAASLAVNNTINENSLLSYFGKVNYSYKEKYLMTAIVRRDGSSRFGNNKKWGTFPSVSVGWRISEEEFIPKNDILSSLKFRAGWGQVGYDDGIGNYASSAVVMPIYNYPLANLPETVSTGSATNGIPNPDIQWETVTQYSIGLDASLFNDKLTMVAEYYNKSQNDMLLQVTQSAVTGLSIGAGQGTIAKNIGELTNEGFEFSANFSGDSGKFSYNIGANITTINNKIVEIPQAIEAFSYKNSFLTRSENGRSLGEFYGWVADGLFQSTTDVENHAFQATGTSPGDIRFKDLSGPEGTPDGVINGFDKTFIGSPVPDFTYGFNLNLYYGNFDFSIQGSGVSGNEIYNISKLDLMDNTRTENKLNFVPWSAENPNSKWPRAIGVDSNNNLRHSSYFVENGSFFRARIIQLGYSFPSELLDKIKLSKCRVYGSVENAFVLTKYSGLDPEVGNAGGNNLSAGIDHFVYPMARVLSVGLNLQF